MANSLLDAGGTILDYSNGKITTEEAMERLGQNGVSTASSIYTGAAAGAVFGPAGALVGSIAGYLVASNVYQSCITILRAGRLAEEEATRVIALCEAACNEMRLQRAEFEKKAYAKIEARRSEFNTIFKQIEEAMNSNNLEATINALSIFTETLGKELKLKDFNEFDEFMKKDEPLVL